MKDKKKRVKSGEMVWFAIGSALTVAGFLIMPPLIQKYGNKAYKKALNTDDIDFDDMGPEIVTFEDETKENE